jgi:hypothetical protein
MMTDNSHDPPAPPESDDVDPDEDFEEETCSFCGRSAFDVERMVVQGGARICNFCIKEFHARLAKAKGDGEGEGGGGKASG